MTKRQRILAWAGGLCLIALAAWAANPSFSSFLTGQFDTGGNNIRFTYSASTTNFNIRNQNGTYGLNVTNLWAGPTAGIAEFVDANGNKTVDFTDVLIAFSTNVSFGGNGISASTVTWLNSSKILQSIANGTGALTNNGAGVLGWYNGFGSGGTTGSNVTSLTVPMGAWFINNVNTGGAISNATSTSLTNSADAWGFADAATNAIRTRLAMPYDWDGQPVKWAFRATCTGTNSVFATNVVLAVRGALIGMGDREDNPTFSSLQWVTNGVNPTNYYQTVAITVAITPGGTLQPTNSILWEVQRLGAATGDTCTNSTYAILESQLYYSRTNRTDFPTSTP